MIYSSAPSVKLAWKDALRRLYDEGYENPSRRFYRSAPAMVCVHDTRGEHYDDLYHLPVSEISEGNRYLITGEDGGGSIDDAIKMIRERLFGMRADGNSQVDRVVEYLQANPYGRNAVLSLWDPMDLVSENPPHVQSVAFHIEDEMLHAKVYARESDGYRRLLPDLSRFATLQHHVADRLGILPGKYAYFSDALHFHDNDREHVDLLLAP